MRWRGRFRLVLCAATCVAAIGVALPSLAASKHGKPPATASRTPGKLPEHDENRPDAVVTVPGLGDRMAAFVRNDVLWLVFDGEDAAVQPNVTGWNLSEMGQVERRTEGGATIFRMAIPPRLAASVARSDKGWQVTLSRTQEHPPVSPEVRVVEDAGRLSLALSMPGLGKPVTVTDPTVGDALTIVTAPPNEAVRRGREFAELEILPAFQGVVIRPVADGVAATRDGDRLTIGAPGGLSLSEALAQTAVRAGNAVADPKLPTNSAPPAAEAEEIKEPRDERRLLDWAAWHLPPRDADETRRILEHRAALADEKGRPLVELDLARLMLSIGQAPEALGYLDLALAGEPDLDARDDVRVLRGAALALLGRNEEAVPDLTAQSLRRTADGTLWRAYNEAQQGRWAEALVAFRWALDRLPAYPDALYRPLVLTMVEAATRGTDPAIATAMLGQLRGRKAVARSARPAIAYFEGRIADLKGDTAKAVELWKPVAADRDQYYRTRAELALVAGELKLGNITAKQATERLDRLRFAWRGDGFELEVLNALAETAVQAEQYETALDSWRQIGTLAVSSGVADQAHERLAQLFRHLFIDGAADTLPPIRALALFQSMRDLAPSGDDGDRALDRLAERMAEVDLLSQAAEIIEGEAGRQVDPVVKAQYGTRAAALRLLDDKPDQAIRTLDATETELGSPESKAARRLMRVRALSKVGRVDEALKLLGSDSSVAADELRVDIGWETKRWRVASDALTRLIGPPPLKGKLDEAKTAMVLRRAVLLGLAQDAAGVAELRREFAPVLAGSNAAAMFEVLTRPASDGNFGNLDAIRSQIAEVDMFKDFLTGYRRAGGA